MFLDRLKEKYNYFRRHRFVQDTAVLQFGSIMGNVFQAGVGVVIARTLQPERYGIYSLALGLAGFASIFLSAGAQDAVTTILGETYERKDQSRIKEVIAFLVKIIAITALMAGIFAVLSPAIAERLYHNRDIGVYAAVVIGAYIISSTFFSLTTMVLQVTGRIRAMMFLELSDQISRTGISMGLTLLGFGIAGAVGGHLVAAIIISLVSFILWEKTKDAFPLIPSLRSVLKHLNHVPIRKYLGFSFWVAVDRNFAMLYVVLPVLLTGLYIAPGELTFFKLGLGWMNLALVLMGPISKLLNVEFPRMKVHDAGSLHRNFIKVSLYSMALSSLLALGAVVVAPLAFKYIYGAAFVPSVKYVFALFPYGAFYGIGVALGPMWRAINKVGTSIIINVVVLGIGIPLGMVLIRRFGLYGSVLMVTLWYTVAHLTAFFYLAKELKRQGVDPVREKSPQGD